MNGLTIAQKIPMKWVRKILFIVKLGNSIVFRVHNDDHNTACVRMGPFPLYKFSIVVGKEHSHFIERINNLEINQMNLHGKKFKLAISTNIFTNHNKQNKLGHSLLKMHIPPFWSASFFNCFIINLLFIDCKLLWEIRYKYVRASFYR